jgi:hypothetical protein
MPKGIKGFQKGHKINYIHKSHQGFQKGYVPYNKGKKGLVGGWNKGMKGYTNSGSFVKGSKGYWLGKKRLNSQEEKSWNWKGDNAGYFAMHDWVERHKGKASHCVDCGTLNAKKYEWSNIDHLYRRNLDDYISRCSSCHKKYDLAMGFVAPRPHNSKGQFIKIKKLI